MDALSKKRASERVSPFVKTISISISISTPLSIAVDGCRTWTWTWTWFWFWFEISHSHSRNSRVLSLPLCLSRSLSLSPSLTNIFPFYPVINQQPTLPYRLTQSALLYLLYSFRFSLNNSVFSLFLFFSMSVIFRWMGPNASQQTNPTKRKKKKEKEKRRMVLIIWFPRSH